MRAEVDQAKSVDKTPDFDLPLSFMIGSADAALAFVRCLSLPPSSGTIMGVKSNSASFLTETTRLGR